MRIRIDIGVKRLPITYRMLFVSLIKEAIKKGNGPLYHHLYEEKVNQPKKYSFAVYLSNFQIEENLIELDGVKMTVSSSDPEIAVALINGFQQIETLDYREWQMTINRIELVKEKAINHPIVRFKTQSPILLEDKQKKPLLLSDANFEEEMNFVTNQQFVAQYGRPLHQPLKIIEHRMKKQVIKEKNHATKGEQLFFTGQKGMIELEGHIEDLKLIYQDGFLCRKSQGLGSLEVEV